MLITNHVLAGASIGAVVRRPAAAFAAGFASHLLMDAFPHWGLAEDAPRREDQFMRVARPDGICGLIAMGAATVAAPKRIRRSVVAAMVGAALPDVDKPSEHFLGVNPAPRWFQRFHGWLQNEASHRLPYEMVTAGVLANLAATTLRL
jgi:hypothetical protein